MLILLSECWITNSVLSNAMVTVRMKGQAEFASVLTSPMQNKQNPKEEPNKVLGQTSVC